MLLLSFAAKNHKSLRDEVVLELTRPGFRTLVPKKGQSWEDVTYPIAGIFGANATGKSAVLDALVYTFYAISYSSTKWQAEKRIPRAPFRLDNVSGNRSSRYELDFVMADRRYCYGFEVDKKGILREWLKDIPTSRWRLLIERDREKQTVRIHPSIGPVDKASDRELILSRSYVVEHEILAPIAGGLVNAFDHVSVRDSYRERRLASIADSLIDGQITFDDIVALLQVADIGVEEVSVEEEDLPPKFREVYLLVKAALTDDQDPEMTTPDSPEGSGDTTERLAEKETLEDDESAAVIRSLLFRHRSGSNDTPPFSIHSESDGTVAWLALMVPALEALKNGGLCCVDEIDSSLHPHLLDAVLGLFSDHDLNQRNAQLIFTSHETYLLSPLSEVDLEPEQVWFTDKSLEGVTSLTCLSEFPRHRDANVARRYLLGRYGGTPRTAPGVLASLIDRGEQ